MLLASQKIKSSGLFQSRETKENQKLKLQLSNNEKFGDKTLAVFRLFLSLSLALSLSLTFTHTHTHSYSYSNTSKYNFFETSYFHGAKMYSSVSLFVNSGNLNLFR